MPTHVHVEPPEGGVARLVLGRPGGAVPMFGGRLAASLIDALDAIEGDPAIEAAVLASAHPHAFLLGAEPDALAQLATRRDAKAWCRAGQAATRRLASTRKPIVAAVHGPALGPGLELALACRAIVLSSDPTTSVRVASDDLGLAPFLLGLPALARRAGLRVALQQVVSGDPMSAEAALACGIADRVARHAALDDAARALARRLAVGAEAPGAHRRVRAADRLALAVPLGRLVLLRRARARVAAEGRPEGGVALRALDLLEAHERKEAELAREAEIVTFGELAVSSVSRGLLSHRRASLADVGDGVPPRAPRALSDLPWAITGRPSPLAKRLVAAYAGELAALLDDGVPRDALDRALLAWGVAATPTAFLEAATAARLVARPVELSGRGGAAGAATRPPIRPSAPIAPEEIQLRCALVLAQEALAALSAGLAPSPAAADLAAVLEVGYPAFRGGPLRWIDDVGPAEVRRRLAWYERSLGPRFAPSPALVELAQEDRRIFGA